MNVFRLLGDLSHLYSIVILIYKIHTRRTTAGISLRTRLLYLLVFVARYGDLFFDFISVYNSFMKILYLGMTSWIVYLMLFSDGYKRTWYADLDDFPTIPLLIGSVIFGIGGAEQYTVFEVLWTFSIVLESVAILPQISHLTKVPTLPALPLSHLVALGLYRFFYVVNWVYRIGTDGVWDFTAFFFGVIQTVIWIDFLWVWYNRKQIRLTDAATPSVINTNASGGVSIGSAQGEDAQQVDSGDLAKSLLLSHIFNVSRAVEAKFLGAFGGGMRGTGPSLSVSAYPERDIRTAEEGRSTVGGSQSAGFTDSPTSNTPTPASSGKPVAPVAAEEAKEWRASGSSSAGRAPSDADDFDDDDLTSRK